MIAATDLRIGNCYLTGLEIVGSREAKLNINDSRIIKLTLKHIEVLAWDNSLINFLYPIKLTPEILEQVGFEIKYSEYYGIDCDGYFVSYDFLYVGTGIQVFDDEGCKVVLLEYLHDIQNFYYQFTKQELPIDINTLSI